MAISFVSGLVFLIFDVLLGQRRRLEIRPRLKGARQTAFFRSQTAERGCVCIVYPVGFRLHTTGEKARICAAGGFVDFGRVNGNLALSRALGDFEFKKSADLAPEQQIVTAYPDVTTHEVTEDDEFLVIACDGT